MWLQVSTLTALCLTVISAGERQHPLQPSDGRQPNIVFIMSDDQDLHMDSLASMPLLRKHMIDQGLTFARHYCTVALCCPSRASLLTGKAAHNTNVTDINPPYGGYPKFVSQGFNEAYLPLWLQDAGYNTYYVGKLLNAQTVTNYDSPHAAGWTGSDFLLDPYTYEYLNATFQRNQDPPVSYEGQYSTDVLAEKAYGFLDDALNARKPFFLGIAPTAPHSNVNIKDSLIDGNFSEHSVTQSPPISAKRHEHTFKDVKVPRSQHFNPEEPSSVSWISRLPRQNQTNLEFNDHFYRNRLRALQPVDEIVEGVMTRLEKAGVLDNTFVFYTTDNGYHIGQHRLQPGKQCPIEEDLNIPFIVRGPGVPIGATTYAVTSHTDLASTFLAIAGAPLRDDFDGAPMPLTTSTLSSPLLNRQEHVNIESWGIIMSEGIYGSTLYPNHTYKSLRVIGTLHNLKPEYNLMYTVWCSGEHELYDLNRDPYQLNNLYPTNHSSIFHFASMATASHNASTPTPLDPTLSHITEPSTPRPLPPTPLETVLHRLNALLLVLKTCKATQCTHPWSYLHPSTNSSTSPLEDPPELSLPASEVHTLHDALNPKYDAYYERLYEEKRVEFERCEKGYILESEGKMWDGREVGWMEFEVAATG